MMKPCHMYSEIKMANGDWKCRCGYDGAIRNHCYGSKCPHFSPTIWWKIQMKIGIRRRFREEARM